MDKEQLEERLELEVQFKKRGGNVPVVVQDEDLQTVLALRYESAESFEKNRMASKACILDAKGSPFFRGYEGPLVTRSYVDCDQDALVYLVRIGKPGQKKDSLFETRVPKLAEGILIPAIAQDYLSGEVLMLGYANQLAVDTAREKQKATFWSTSRDELWTKGETSGDILRLREIQSQKNGAVLYLVEMVGKGACHTKNNAGEARRSCFYRRITPSGTLEFLPGME